MFRQKLPLWFGRDTQQPSSFSPLIFPHEIWQKIFALACVDGGATGCSLSLVSHQIRNISSSTRLQSVLVCGLARMKSLLCLLESAREDGRHVRFLFIGIERPKATDGDTEDPLALARRQFNEGHRKRRREWSSLVGILTSALPGLRTADDGATDMRTVYEKIIGLVAPYLEVLTSHLNHETLPHVPFPRLPSLAVTGYNLAGSTPPPHLRHLHILGLYYAHELPLWVAGTPELEHLRLSEVWAERELPEVLGALMGVEEQQYSDTDRQSAVMAGIIIRAPRPDIQALKCLKTVVVDTRENMSLGMCGNSHMDHHSMRRGLACLESESADGPVKLVLIRGRCRNDEQSMIEWQGMVETITNRESLKE